MESTALGGHRTDMTSNDDSTTWSVLLADDSLVTHRLVEASLTGHQITLANDGLEALDQIARHSFDVVLMDIEMPELDGREATRRIRENERSSGTHLPILALTAHELTNHQVQELLDAGFDRCLEKPPSRDKLLQVIAEVMADASVSDDSLDEMAGGSASSADSPRRFVDWNVARAFVQNDDDLLRDIVVAFIAESSPRLELITQAIADRDHVSLQRNAHTLKGNLRYFGAESTMELAQELEAIGRREESEEGIPFLAQLTQDLAAVVAELRAFLDSTQS